jgi:hypothetical protein
VTLCARCPTFAIEMSEKYYRSENAVILTTEGRKDPCYSCPEGNNI